MLLRLKVKTGFGMLNIRLSRNKTKIVICCVIIICSYKYVSRDISFCGTKQLRYVIHQMWQNLRGVNIPTMPACRHLPCPDPLFV